MIVRGLWFGAAFLAASVMTGLPAAYAQQDGVRVQDRPRPDFDPVGGRMGGFIAYPTLETRIGYDTNIFASDGDEESDIVGIIRPELSIESDWSRHALNANVFGEIGQYADFRDESYEDYGAGLDGRLDVLRSTTLFGDISVARLHEDRGSPDDVNGEEPTEFTDFNTGLNAVYQRSRILLSGDADYQRLDFDNVETSTGDSINNDDRDRGIATTGGRVGYEIIPNYLAFVRGEYNNRHYRDARDDNGFDRDSQGYSVGVGTQFRVTGITRGSVSVGYQEQFYEDSQLDDVSDIEFALNLTWLATELTTVDFAGARTVEETTLDEASAYINTNVRVDVAHELRRNIILAAGVSYANNNYEGIDRTDHLGSVLLDASYLINRNFNVGAEYEFRLRESDAENADYTRNIVFLRGTLQF